MSTMESTNRPARSQPNAAKAAKVSEPTLSLAAIGIATRRRNTGIGGSQHQPEVSVPQVVPSSETRRYGGRQRLPTATDRQMPRAERTRQGTDSNPVGSQSVSTLCDFQ